MPSTNQILNREFYKWYFFFLIIEEVEPILIFILHNYKNHLFLTDFLKIFFAVQVNS